MAEPTEADRKLAAKYLDHMGCLTDGPFCGQCRMLASLLSEVREEDCRAVCAWCDKGTPLVDGDPSRHLLAASHGSIKLTCTAWNIRSLAPQPPKAEPR